MKLKDFKKLLDTSTENAEIKIKNNEIVIIEPKPIEYKFKVGDKVRFNTKKVDYVFVIIKQIVINGLPGYEIEDKWGETSCLEKDIELYVPKDITEQIKTFEDAYEWCNNNGYAYLTCHYLDLHTQIEKYKYASDILAYIKLRIITIALNEGWEPSDGKDKFVYIPKFNDEIRSIATTVGAFGDAALKLAFKTEKLAEYAATQFSDIYADFCGCKKGDKL